MSEQCNTIITAIETIITLEFVKSQLLDAEGR